MAVWLALLVAPLLALADQVVAYAAVDPACAGARPLPVHAIHAVFLLAAAATAVPAWRLWRASRGRGEESARSRHFLAGMAVAVAALSVLVIAAMWMPTWFIAPCVR